MSQKSILRYQLIFRFLLRLKSVEQDLLDLWTDQKAYPWVGSYKSDTLTIGRGGGDRSATPTLSGFRSATPVVRSTTPVSRPPSSLTHASGIPIPPSPAPTHTESIFSELSRWKMRVIILRSRMLSFIQSILSYATFEVVEPKWRELEVKLGKVNTGEPHTLVLKLHLIRKICSGSTSQGSCRLLGYVSESLFIIKWQDSSCEQAFRLWLPPISPLTSHMLRDEGGILRTQYMSATGSVFRQDDE